MTNFEELRQFYMERSYTRTRQFRTSGIYDVIISNRIVNSSIRLEPQQYTLEVHKCAPTKFISHLNIKCGNRNILNIKISDNLQRTIEVNNENKIVTIYFNNPAISITCEFPTDYLFQHFLYQFVTCYENNKRSNTTLLMPTVKNPVESVNYRTNNYQHIRPVDATVTAFYNSMIHQANNDNISSLMITLESRARLAELSFASNTIPTLGSSQWKWMNKTSLHQSLTILELIDNNITELPEEIGYFKSLHELNLDKNNLEALPEMLGTLPIICLTVAMNNLGSGGSSSWNWLKGKTLQAHLTTLHLNDNNITQLPDEIATLKVLEALHLSNNKLHTLPEAIKSLEVKIMLLANNNLGHSNWKWLSGGNIQKALKFLILDQNDIQTFPDEICNLTALESLNLTNNKLTKLPNALGSMLRINMLDVSNNKLGMIESCNWNWIKGLRIRENLKVLALDNNAIKQLPHEIGAMKNLCMLSVSQNNLEKLSLSVRNKIHFICATQNNLKSLPGFLAEKYLLYERASDHIILTVLLAFDDSRLPQSAVPTLQEIAARNISDTMFVNEYELPKCLAKCFDYPTFCECGQRCFTCYTTFKINIPINRLSAGRGFLWDNDQENTIAIEYIFCSVNCYQKKCIKLQTDVTRELQRRVSN